MLISAKRKYDLMPDSKDFQDLAIQVKEEYTKALSEKKENEKKIEPN